MDNLQNSDQERKILIAQVNDLAEKALRDQEPQWTDFLEPPDREQVQAVLGWNQRVRFNSFGGYAKAERRRMVIYPDYYIVETIQPALSFLEINVKSPEPLSHRDYLGAILGLGLKREKLGDLLVAPDRCQLVIVPELVDFLRAHLQKVGNHQAELAEIDPEQLNPPEQREKVIRSTVASLRLDAIAGLGFGESRTKMVKEIRSERVKVNWKVVKNPDASLEPGAVISIRGRGRVIFKEITGTSKKGRIGVVLVRML
ncbi:MAG: RNA-binding protein [Bacteroidota bacterium]